MSINPTSGASTVPAASAPTHEPTNVQKKNEALAKAKQAIADAKDKSLEEQENAAAMLRRAEALPE